MTSTRWSVLLVLLEGGAKFAIGLASVVILARLLTPEDIGVFSIAYGYVAIGHILRELGVNTYLIQEPDLTSDRVRSAFTVSLVMAWAIGGALTAASIPIANFYRIEGLKPILMLLSLNFLLVPFGAITLALLRRNLQFGVHASINLVSLIVSTVVTVYLAAGGHGAMSLAWGTTAGLFATVGMCLVLRPKSTPRWPGTKEIRRVLSFGLWSTGGSTVSQAGISGPDMIIGKVLGATDTGMFSKAFGVVDTFNRLVLQSVSSFSTPHFSARIRAGLDVRETYLHAVALITGIGWPFFVLLALCAEPIVYLLLGPQWEAAAPIARLLCLSAAVSATFAPFPNLLLASGGAKDYTKYMTVSSSARIIAVLGTAWLGLHAVAWSLAAAATFSAIVATWMLSSRAQIAPHRLWNALRPSIGVCAAALGAAGLASTLPGPQSPLFQLLVVSISVAIGSLAAARWLRHPAWQEFVHGVAAARAHLRAG